MKSKLKKLNLKIEKFKKVATKDLGLLTKVSPIAPRSSRTYPLSKNIAIELQWSFLGHRFFCLGFPIVQGKCGGLFLWSGLLRGFTQKHTANQICTFIKQKVLHNPKKCLVYKNHQTQNPHYKIIPKNIK